LFVIDGLSCTVDCGRPAGTKGSTTGLAWYNPSAEPADLFFVIDWSGGWPNPSAIPSSGPYSLDVSFDAGAPEGESCLAPSPLAVNVASVVSPGLGTNDEGPGMGVDHVYSVTVAAHSKLNLSAKSMSLRGATAEVYTYLSREACGTTGFNSKLFVSSSQEASTWSFENRSSRAVEVTLLVESWGSSNLGSLIVEPIITSL